MSLPGVIVTLERLQTTSGHGLQKTTGFGTNFNEAWNRNRSSVEVQGDILPKGFVFFPARGFVLEEPKHEVIQIEVFHMSNAILGPTSIFFKARIIVVDGVL